MKHVGNTSLRWALLAVLATGGLASAQSEKPAGVLDTVAPAIVTVKVVIKFEIMAMGQSQNEESRSELTGVVVDESGLVMISNSEISAERMERAFAGNPMAGSVEFELTPTDFQVIFGNEPEEYPAFLVAKDTKLDLAFLQVQELGDRELSFISFDDTAKPAIGDEIVAVSRLKKGFDYAPFLATARISGAIRKPRKAFIVDGTVSSYGLPVFSSGGDVVGVLVTLAPSTADEDAGGTGFSSFMRFVRGSGPDTGVGTFVLPGKVVRGLIGQSKKKAAEMLEEQQAED